MATRVRRVSDFAKHGMQYLLRRDQIAPLNKERDREKEWLKTYIGDGKHDGMGIQDEKGNLNVYFDAPVPGPGNTTYYGMQQRVSPGAEFMNTDEVKQFMGRLASFDGARAEYDKELYNRVVYTKTIEVVDTEELYVLQQEGKITAKQLRSLIRHEDPTYQLWPITEPPVEDDDWTPEEGYDE